MILIRVSVTGFAGQEPYRHLPAARDAIVAELAEGLGDVIFDGEREHEKSRGMRYFDFSAEFTVPGAEVSDARG